MVRLRANGFCYTINIKSLPRLLLDVCCRTVLWRSCSSVDWRSAGLALYPLQQFIDGIGQLKALDLGRSGI